MRNIDAAGAKTNRVVRLRERTGLSGTGKVWRDRSWVVEDGSRMLLERGIWDLFCSTGWSGDNHSPGVFELFKGRPLRDW
jgi:hypothetical protein